MVDGSSSVIEDEYTHDVTHGDFTPIINNTISNKYQYPSAYGYEAIQLAFEFPESKYVLGQSYQLRFNVSEQKNYIYTYFLPYAIPLTFNNKFFQENDEYYPYKLNSAFLSGLSDTQKKGMITKSFSGTNEVVMDITIPEDYLYNMTEKSDRSIVIFMYATYWANDTNKITNTTYSNIRLIPTGSTQYLYADQQFQDDVIGSEDSGGLKGIFYELKQLPSRFGLWISSLGDRIGGFFTDLMDGLINGIKDLFIPTEQQINDFKDRTDQLLSDHLGVIYQAPNIMIDFIQELADFEPLRSDDKNDYYIEFPSKNIYLNSDAVDSLNIISESDNGGEVIPLIPDNTGNSTYRWSFGWLNDKPFSTFYSVYNVVIIFITVIGFCSYCIRKYNNIMEG